MAIAWKKDTHGADFPGFAEARAEAERAAREILARAVVYGEVIDGETFEITNEAGAVLDSLPFKSVLRLE